MKLIITAILATILAAGAQTRDEAERMLKAAQNAELVDGNLKAAIEQYDTIVARFSKADRAVTADALVRMAECYTKLGDAEAVKIYERVVTEFADQAGSAATARERLGSTDQAVLAKGDRVVWAGAKAFPDAKVSRDGRFISYIDWYLTGNLMLHDVVSDTERPLTGNKDWSGPGNATTSTFSPDGKQVAYGWKNYGEKLEEIRIVNVEGTGIPQPRRVFANQDLGGISPTDWPSDGKWLAVLLMRKDRTQQIGLVGVQDGSLRVLKSVGWRGPNKIFFSPDNKYMAYDLPASDADSQRDVFVIAVDGSRETPAVAHPAHDVVMGWSPDGSYLLFASDRAGSMGLWALPFADGRPHAAPTMLKPDIASASSVGLTASGALHIFKDASTQSLQVAPIDLAAEKLLGTPVLQSFRSARPDWSPDGKYLAYRSIGSDELQVLSMRSVESGQVRELRTALHYFNEPRWMPDARSLMTFGRDLKGRPGIYRIDAQTGAVSFVTPSDNARVQVSPDGKKIYYRLDFNDGDSTTPGRVIERDLASGQTREVFRFLPAVARVDSPELSPDGRYMASIITEAAAKTSTVLLIPVAGGEPRELLRVSLPEFLIGYGRMSWTPDSRAVIVVKRTGKREEDRKELWLVPLSQGKARKLDIDLSTWVLSSIRLHPNGQQIAFFTGKRIAEFWALENFLPAGLRGRSRQVHVSAPINEQTTLGRNGGVHILR